MLLLQTETLSRLSPDHLEKGILFFFCQIIHDPETVIGSVRDLQGGIITADGNIQQVSFVGVFCAPEHIHSPVEITGPNKLDYDHDSADEYGGQSGPAFADPHQQDDQQDHSRQDCKSRHDIFPRNHTGPVQQINKKGCGSGLEQGKDST